MSITLGYLELSKVCGNIPSYVYAEFASSLDSRPRHDLTRTFLEYSCLLDNRLPTHVYICAPPTRRLLFEHAICCCYPLDPLASSLPWHLLLGTAQTRWLDPLLMLGTTRLLSTLLLRRLLPRPGRFLEEL